VIFEGEPQMRGEYQYDADSSSHPCYPSTERYFVNGALLGNEDCLLRYARLYYLRAHTWEGFAVEASRPVRFQWESFELRVLERLTLVPPDAKNDSPAVESSDETAKAVQSLTEWTTLDWTTCPSSYDEYLTEWQRRKTLAASSEQKRILEKWTTKSNRYFESEDYRYTESKFGVFPPHTSLKYKRMGGRVVLR
jgi:hypothetical protein